MWTFLSERRVSQLSVGWSIVVIVGIFVSDFVRVLPSIGVAGLFITGLAYGISRKCIAQRTSCPEILSLTLVYGVHLVSGLTHGTGAGEELGRDLLLQMPFLLLPVAFFLLPSLSAQHKTLLWLVLIGCCLVAAGRATIYYLLHYEAINHLYVLSGSMPTVPDHIRFSLLVSIAVVVGAVLAFDEALPLRLRWSVGAGVLPLFVFQHLFAVRSGLITMYAAGGLWLVWLGGWQRRWKALAAVIALVGGLALGSLWLFPTLRDKMDNTRYDMAQVEQVSAANNYSITARVYSYKIAWILIRQHPWVGVSKVRMNEEIAQQYSYSYPEIAVSHYLLPHNQFLFNLLAYGIIGLACFLVGFYYPLWAALRTRNVLMVLVYVIVSISFLVEYTLETHIGILTGIFFLLLAAVPIRQPVARPDAVRLASSR